MRRIKSLYLLITIAHFSLMGCAQTITKPDSVLASNNNPKQDSSFLFYNKIPGSFSYMDVDVLGNIYLITATNQLKKLNPNGDSMAVFNDVKQFGKLSMLDVSNPLKILLYYKNYSTVVILDRFLSLRNSINFRKQNIFKVKTLATSYDNNIWLFDEQDFKLKKINDEGVAISETSDFRQIFDDTPLPSQIIDRENYVYLYDEVKGFYIFDYYGSLKSNLPFLNWQHIAVTSTGIMGFVGDTLYSYQLNSLNLITYKLPVLFSQYDDIKAINGKLYLLKKDGIEIYNIL